MFKDTSNLGTILPIALTKLLLEIALLAQDNPDMHDDEKRGQHDNAPPCIDHQGEAEVNERESHIEGIAGEAIWAGCDDGRGGERWINVRTSGLQRSSSPYRDANAKYEQCEAWPESNGMGEDGHRPEPAKHKNNDERDGI